MGVVAALSVKIGANTQDFTAGLNSLLGQVDKAAAGIGGAFNVTSLSTFGKSIGEVTAGFASLSGALGGLALGKIVGDFVGTTSKLTDLSAKTSISVRELQRLDYAGSQVGVSLDTIATSATQLQKRLAGGDSGAASAVRELGLSLDQLLTMGAGEQFEAIASALAKMENPARQTFLAMELFGRGGAALLPLLRSDMQSVGDEMERLGLLMSDKTVKAGDDLGDVWTKLGFAGTKLVSEALKPVLEHIGKLDTEKERLVHFLEALNIDAIIPAWKELSKWISAVSTDISGAPKLPGAPSGFGKANLDKAPDLVDAKEATKLFDEAEKKAKQAAEEWQRFKDTVSGKDDIAEAQKWMKAVKEIGGVTNLTAENQKRFNDVLGQALETYASLGQQAPQDMAKLWAATFVPPGVIDRFDSLKNSLQEVGTLVRNATFLDWASPSVSGMPDVLPGEPVPVSTVDHLYVSPWREAFGTFGKQLPDIIFGAMMGGGSVVGALASGLAAQFAQSFQERVAATELAGTSLSGGATALGVAGMGLSAGIGGFAMGQKFGKTKGALGGAATGAMAGAAFGSVVPGIGTAIGAGIGAVIGGIGGLFGGRSKDKKDREAMEEQRKELLEQFGGMEKLKKLAVDLGVDIDKAFSTKKPMEFQATVEKLNTALEKQQATIKATGEIVAGVNARAANVTGQGDLDVVGAGAVAGFALMMQNGSSAIEAFQALTPAITAMNTAMATGNFTLSESAMKLTELGAILNANNVEFTNLGASGQILSAMMQGNIRDGSLFAAVATDIGTQIQTVIDRGVPMGQVFALAQPQLQALWEAQQKWGFAVDATTQGLLTEAAAQGFVGQQMKSVNQQILDVLLAIGKVLGADIPAAFAGLPAAAQSAANGINAAFAGVGGIQEMGSGTVDQLVPMARGGIVRRPTAALIGEAGPEAVMPLNGAFNTGGGTAIIQLEGRTLAEAIVPAIPGVVQRYGLA